jgi:EAL domain-containing protein (putative c-di-GMP-specific phosphodiesterase class I)
MGAEHDLRTEHLRLKAAIYDPNTDLRSIPAVLDNVRVLFDLGRWVGVIHVAVRELPRIESIYGWQATDRLLGVVARVLHSSRGSLLPAETVLAQTGIYGGSFAAFLPVNAAAGTPREMLDVAASAVHARLADRFATPDFETMSPRVGFSMGYAAMINEPFFRLERMIYRCLDEAASLAERDESQRRSGDQVELRRILDDGDIEVVFQPVVNLDDSSIMGYEALCRGPRNTSFEKPEALFGVSHRASMGRELDLLCQRRALERAGGILSGSKLFLNALPESLLDAGFRDHLLRDLPAGLHIGAEDIVLEIADRDAIGDFRKFESEVGELRTHGFRLGVDDVGTGAGSLQTIAEVKPDYIKVDGSLIHDIHANLVKQEMLRSLSKVAQSIRATLVAEGIETEEDLQAVMSCGVHYGQGFLLAPPERDPAETLPGH